MPKKPNIARAKEHARNEFAIEAMRFLSRPGARADLRDLAMVLDAMDKGHKAGVGVPMFLPGQMDAMRAVLQMVAMIEVEAGEPF